jgi:hypothetical protein
MRRSRMRVDEVEVHSMLKTSLAQPPPEKELIEQISEFSWRG